MLLSTSALDGMVEGLEEVLLANPDDLFTHRAYADLLIRHRDPAFAARGRLIEAQLKLEQPGGAEEVRKKLERRNKKLLKDHGRFWLGSLAPYLLDQQGLEDEDEYRFELARGWLDTVVAPVLHLDFIKVLARAPQARLLRKLVIESAAPGGPEALAPLLGASFLPSLRVFWLGPVPGSTDRAAEWSKAVGDLVAQLPRCEELFTPWHRR
jgi:hypothetical protein